MAKLDAEYFKSRKQFLVGLLLAAMGIVLFLLIGSTEVRFDLQGLKEVRGRVLHAESYKPGRHSSYQLVMTLDTGSGAVRLWQEASGYYAQFFTPGQQVRAWISPESDEQMPPSHRVWQIQRGSQVVMPVMEVGDRVFNRLLWDGGAALIPLLGGLFMIGRHLARYHAEDAGTEEGRSA
jgi:hypothetical protein